MTSFINNPLILHLSDPGQQAADKESKKTWKGKVAKQWRKMQGTSGVTLSAYPEGGSIGGHFLFVRFS